VFFRQCFFRSCSRSSWFRTTLEALRLCSISPFPILFTLWRSTWKLQNFPKDGLFDIIMGKILPIYNGELCVVYVSHSNQWSHYEWTNQCWTRWWFQIYLFRAWNDPIWLIIFQMGWNYQLVNVGFWISPKVAAHSFAPNLRPRGCCRTGSLGDKYLQEQWQQRGIRGGRADPRCTLLLKIIHLIKLYSDLTPTSPQMVV